MLILASRSPRRQQLLQAAGYQFAVAPAELVETPLPGETPAECARRLAEQKATVIACQYPQAAVLAADTMVALGAELLGKPASSAAACRMLQALSGQTHQVHTGLALLLPRAAPQTGVVTSTVTFRHLTDEEIARYVNTGEPLDKAGAYALQGGAGAFVARLEGSWSNVVGLPMETVSTWLAAAGITPRRLSPP